MKNTIITLSALGFTGTLLAAGIPRDSNFNNSSIYDNTRVEARMVVPVREDTKVVHFIRDNNDPRVVTKTYHIKNVDVNQLRDSFRQMVQAKRIGNTSLLQSTPTNTTFPPVQGVSSAVPGTTSAQPLYTPDAQIGSNSAVECLKYVDGTGLLIISAEEYRFRDHENGMGFDAMVELLDRPEMGASSGCQIFLYQPKFVPARNLMPMIENVGMNITDATELWQGQDLVAYDPDLNWLVFDVTNYSEANIAKMLNDYDVPIPEVRLKISVYEIYRENDDKIGVDFQAWKNNEGVDFFSIGGRYRDNWSAIYGGGLADTGSERTSYYNFNPKWNSRYLDFLASQGRAKVAYTGELCIRNNSPATLDRRTQIFYMDVSQPAPGSTTNPDMGVGPYELLSSIVAKVIPDEDVLPVGKGDQQIVTKFAGFGFQMQVSNAAVNLNETRFSIAISNSSLIGFQSNGTPRISNNSVVQQDVSLPHGKDSFIIGGLKKEETVKSSGGVPWLKDIPYLGYLFSTESTSTKYSELVVVGQCELASPVVENPPVGKGKTIKQGLASNTAP